MRAEPYALKVAQRLGREDVPFDALIIAAIQRADTNNLAGLRYLFPDTYEYVVHAWNCPECSNNKPCAVAGTKEK